MTTTPFAPCVPHADVCRLWCVKICDFPALTWHWEYRAEGHETPEVIDSLHFWRPLAQMGGRGDQIEIVWPDGTRAVREVVSMRGGNVRTRPRDALVGRAA